MGIDIGPVGAISDLAQAAKGILGMFFPDKTEEEKNKMAAAFAMIQNQTQIDQAEAQSADPLQHWRGALGWVIVLCFFNNYLLCPWAQAFGVKVVMVDVSALYPLLIGMLGLGGMHVYQQVNSK